jgi:hypothetical protein
MVHIVPHDVDTVIESADMVLWCNAVKPIIIPSSVSLPHWKGQPNIRPDAGAGADTAKADLDAQ